MPCLWFHLFVISSNGDSIFGENKSMRCSKICSYHMPIVLVSTISSCAKCFTLCLLWSNFMICKYVYCYLIVCTQKLNFFKNYSFRLVVSCMPFIMSSNQLPVHSVCVKAVIFLKSRCLLMLLSFIWEATYLLNEAQWVLATLGFDY